MTVSGDSLWPSAGIFMAAVVEIFVAADIFKEIKEGLLGGHDSQTHAISWSRRGGCLFSGTKNSEPLAIANDLLRRTWR
jgi:hypothetical protein